MAKEAQQAIKAFEAAERECLRRKEAARQYINHAHEARETSDRLFARVKSGDVDIFR